MEFRWLASIALWTILSGPVFGPPSGGAARPKERPAAKKINKPALARSVAARGLAAPDR